LNLVINYFTTSRKKSVGIKKELNKIESVFIFFLKKDRDLVTGFSKKVKEIELSLTICGKRKIRTLNRDYLSKDYVTDVLSFPVNSSFVHNKNIVLFDRVDLGDIFICKEKAITQAKEFGISVNSEIIHLLVHGFLHLLGFDHELSEFEKKRMEKKEAQLVGRIMKKIGAV
jgi:probable rRNA maturation factor